MQVFVGADYRGFERKNQLVDFLMSQGFEVIDDGAFSYQEGDDFNEPAVRVARDVRENPEARGILICESAHGMTMQTNRFKRVRAAHCDSVASAILAREHDDANVLCLSAGTLDKSSMQDIASAFLSTVFEPIERRVRRINKLDEREDYA